jgi:hypothetical protein
MKGLPLDEDGSLSVWSNNDEVACVRLIAEGDMDGSTGRTHPIGDELSRVVVPEGCEQMNFSGAPRELKEGKASASSRNSDEIVQMHDFTWCWETRSRRYGHVLDMANDGNAELLLTTQGGRPSITSFAHARTSRAPAALGIQVMSHVSEYA